MVPFSPSWDPKKQKQVELDAMSLEYIQTMSKIVVQRSKLTMIFFLKFTSCCFLQCQWLLLILLFTPSEAELSALREEGGDNSTARPLVWLVELFLD
jgi:hypothetical protein